MDDTGHLGVGGSSMPDFFIGEDEMDSWLNYDPPAESRGSDFINVEPSGVVAAAADVDPDTTTGDRKRKSHMWSDDGSDDRKQKTMSSKEHAAQVHNLSERKRRERINQKMKALQYLIPRCHKTDKAAILDDAAEYIKSLQFQIKMMMTMIGCWVPPMMYNNNQLFVPTPLVENLSHGDDGVPAAMATASTAPQLLIPTGFTHSHSAPFEPNMMRHDQQN